MSFEEVFRKEVKRIKEQIKAITELINSINSEEDTNLRIAMLGANIGALLERVKLPTIIKNGVKIGAKNNIAHNNIIGENTVFAVGAITNGSVTIGKNCWISSGAIIKNYVNICDDVVIGMGAVVSKDINKSGIYTGMPARYVKPLKKGWNF